MAILSKDGMSVTAERGDNLWNIAYTYLGDGLKYTYLAQLNNIQSPYRIYIGQVIKIKAASVSSSTKQTTGMGGGSFVPSITAFGLQTDTDRTIFATWSWSHSHTKNYRVIWYYDTGDNVWFVGNDSTVNDPQSTYNAPTNAKYVGFRVLPISDTYKNNDQETNYWNAGWSVFKTYNFYDSLPATPSTPSVKVDKYKLTAELSNLGNINATHIEFQIVKNNTSIFKTGRASIQMTAHVSYSCTVDVGNTYKVRCRAIRQNGVNRVYGEWSDFSSDVTTIPSTPAGITICRANSETSVYLEWTSVANAKTYDIEYATKITYFDSSDATNSITGVEFNHYEKTGLESGTEYFFRIRAVNDQGSSSWSVIRSVIIGSEPSAPTTWSSATTIVTGEPLTLYWVHNAEDNSSQTYAELELEIGDSKDTKTIKNTTDEDEKDKTSSYVIDTSEYTEGVKIRWRVRTAGITKVYGDWSVQRVVDIYAPPTLQLNITNADGNDIETLESFPFYVKALAGPETQTPIGYHVSIVSNKIYETVDNIGNVKTVNKGDEIYSKYFDITGPLTAELSASDLTLENSVDYTITCMVSMNSGLTAESSSDITVSWSETAVKPNAEISIDKDTLVAYIRPYYENYPYVIYKVSYSEGVYTRTSVILPDTTEGMSVIDAYTSTGEMVFSTTSGGETIYFCVVQGTEGVLVDGVLLSVYRREFDGSFTEIAKDINNTSRTFVTDPHPSLDYARYRVIAKTESTGAISYYDLPGYPVGEKAIVIQWDEEWTNFNTTVADALEQPPWAGSLLKLPYNIDVSDSHSLDVTLVEYIGRKHPVTYYGTQLGETSTWNVSIPKGDVDTLYALRRLAIWTGDVYVREPSGSGYWANISVSFSQTHCEVTIPVAIDITRVEGGV